MIRYSEEWLHEFLEQDPGIQNGDISHARQAVVPPMRDGATPANTVPSSVPEDITTVSIETVGGRDSAPHGRGGRSVG